MQEHWRAGYYDAVRALRHPEVLERPTNHEGVFTSDLSHDGREEICARPKPHQEGEGS
jgi:NTE family protein